MANEVRLIECRDCDEKNCNGCNIYTLAEMLCSGVLDCLMDEHHCIAIDPESLRPKGRWIDHMIRDWRCSECGEKIHKVRSVDGYCYDDKPNYCPNCGAKMEG